MNYIDNLLKKLGDRKLVLFGLSSFGKIAMDYLLDLGVNIDYFCDNDSSKWGKEILDIEVISPKKLCELGKEINILITSISFKEVEEIIMELKSLDFRHIYIYYLDIIKNKYKLEKLLNILADHKSKEVLKNIINYHFTRNLDFIRKIAENNQYFVKDIIKLNKNEVFIDGGAYNGDTLLNFITKVNGRFKKCFSFEPDTKNYSKLNKFIQDNELKNIFIYKKGLFSRDGFETFLSQERSSRINNNIGKEEIEVIKLDNFLENEKVSFIKMDIEGAELEALHGAKNIINNNEPKLAICIYHKLNDLWEIPLFINSLSPEYKIFIRQHSFFKPYGTICYAVI